MRMRDGVFGRRQPLCRRGPLIGVIILLCLAGLQSGCANDPHSRKRIALRRAHIQQTIQAINEHEAAAAVRMRYQIKRIGDWYQEDEKMFAERMRTAGNNIW